MTAAISAAYCGGGSIARGSGGAVRMLTSLSESIDVTGAPYREVNSKVATAPKLKVEDKDRVNNSRRIKTVKLNIVKLKASLK